MQFEYRIYENPLCQTINGNENTTSDFVIPNRYSTYSISCKIRTFTWDWNHYIFLYCWVYYCWIHYLHIDKKCVQLVFSSILTSSEKTVLPHIFLLKGIDINRESISIINARSVTNIKFFIKIVKGFGIPFVVLIDKHSNKPNYKEYYIPLNQEIVSLAGSENVYMMDPEFEKIFGLPEKGDKIRNAIEKVKTMCEKDIPPIMNNAIDRLMEL